MNIKALRLAERPLFTAFAELTPVVAGGVFVYNTPVQLAVLQPNLGYFFESYSVVATCGKELFYRAVSGDFTMNVFTQATRQLVNKKPLRVNSMEAINPAEFYWRSTQPSNAANRTDNILLTPSGQLNQTAEIAALGVIPLIRVSFVVYEIVSQQWNEYQAGGR